QAGVAAWRTRVFYLCANTAGIRLRHVPSDDRVGVHVAQVVLGNAHVDIGDDLSREACLAAGAVRLVALDADRTVTDIDRDAAEVNVVVVDDRVGLAAPPDIERKLRTPEGEAVRPGTRVVRQAVQRHRRARGSKE